MAAGIDSSLLSDQPKWCQRAYSILDEMSSRGNATAKMIGSELKQLESLLSRLTTRHEVSAPIPSDATYNPDQVDPSLINSSTSTYSGYEETIGTHFSDTFDLNNELSADQLMDLANSLDIDSLTWPLPATEDLGDHSIWVMSRLIAAVCKYCQLYRLWSNPGWSTLRSVPRHLNKAAKVASK